MVYHMNKHCNEHIRACHGLGTMVHHKTGSRICTLILMESSPLSACRKIKKEIVSIIMCIYWICCTEFLKNTVSQNSAVQDVASFQHAGTFFTFSGA